MVDTTLNKVIKQAGLLCRIEVCRTLYVNFGFNRVQSDCQHTLLRLIIRCTSRNGYLKGKAIIFFTKTATKCMLRHLNKYFEKQNKIGHITPPSSRLTVPRPLLKPLVVTVTPPLGAYPQPQPPQGPYLPAPPHPPAPQYGGGYSTPLTTCLGLMMGLMIITEVLLPVSSQALQLQRSFLPSPEYGGWCMEDFMSQK